MSPRLRLLGLPLVSVALVAAVLGIQLARGGGDFVPLRTADPCQQRVVAVQSAGIDALVERLVLLGLDAAACELRISREALTLELAETRDPPQEQVDALRNGLRAAVVRLEADGSLPRTSDLLDEALDEMDLNRLVKAALRALPDSFVDGALPSADLLHRMVDDLDLRALLADLDDQRGLEQQIAEAVVPAVRASLRARVEGLL